MSEQFHREGFWVEQWQQKLDGYLQAPPRAGIFVRSLLGSRVSSILELGAGSCRDSLYLGASGYRCTASDFNAQTMQLLRARFPDSGVRFSVDDSRKLGFSVGEFDLVFHNGLIVCFDQDSDAHAILREQFRVARRYALVLVHNGENARLRAQFEDLARTDPLYRIRFFTRQQLADTLAGAGVGWKSLRLLKFGGSADAFYGPRIRGVPNPLRAVAPSFVKSLYRYQPWSRVERIAALAEL
jgi:SAM-dependent methyltransferase